MNSVINQWAVRWRIPYAALAELQTIFGYRAEPSITSEKEHTEEYVKSLVRLEAAKKGVVLWRNNVGVLKNEKGAPVRYGLGNDSANLNKVLKSGDLIGWRSLYVTPPLMGQTIAQFVSRECKRPDWTYTATEHEIAQLRWAEAVNADGGDAQFVTGEGTL